MIKIIDIGGFRIQEIEDVLNQNPDWELVSFGENSYMTRGMGLCVPPKRVSNYFMAVKPVVENPKEFEI